MRSNSRAEARRAPPSGPLPYEPSVPCARCARGVDPLRAACVSATETRLHYFCSRTCRAHFTQAEAAHAERAARSDKPLRLAPAPDATPVARSYEPVSRRIEQAKVPGLALPPVLALTAMAVSMLPVAGALPIAALGLMASAGLLASQAVHTRAAGGRIAWLAAPGATVLLGVSTLLAPDPRPLVAAAIGVVGSFLRERWLAQAEARRVAERAQREARLPVRASVIADGQQIARPIATLREGDEVVVASPSVAPVDGLIVEGEAEVLPYPGAATPVQRTVGAALLAGALVTRGSLRVRAVRVGRACALSRAFAAPTSEPLPRALAVSHEARRWAAGGAFVGALVALSFLQAAELAAGLGALGAGLLGLPLVALARGPLATLRAARAAATAHGASFRDLPSLDGAGRVDTAIIRVEGTLIARACAVQAVRSLSEVYDARDLTELAAAAETIDESHPIARAISEFARANHVKPAVLRRLTRLPGRGISALTDGAGELVLGSREALLAAGVSVAIADRDAHEAERAGRRVVFLSVGGHVRGLFQLALLPRPGVREALRALGALGIEVALVASDHRTTIEALAEGWGIAPGKAELSADQRADEVRHLTEADARIVAIGRLPHDERLFTQAELSICMGGAGVAATAIATASTDLHEAVTALALARRARVTARAVVALAGAVGLAALLAAAALLPAAATAVLALALDGIALAAAPAYARTLDPRTSGRAEHAKPK